MSEWKVSKQRIKLFEHPNADKLQLAKIGNYQCVVQKGLYKDGDEVVFAPEKSVLTGRLRDEYDKYLGGPDKDRVRSVVLRGEYSCGIIIPPELLDVDVTSLPENVDVSNDLGISKYIPEVPKEMEGQLEPILDNERYTKHDCEQYGIYADEIKDGERVVVTEKVHGTQAVYHVNMKTGSIFVSSKNQLSNGLMIIKSDDSIYWKAAENAGLWEILKEQFTISEELYRVQVFAEAFPSQRGYGYGQDKPTLRVFDVRVNDESVPYDQLNDRFRSIWIPVLFDGEMRKNHVREFAKGNEQVSGEEVHIREGCVVSPYRDRRAEDGTRLRLKIINPAYRETGEEFN